MISKTTHQNFAFKFLVSKASRRILLLLFLSIAVIAVSQIGTQSLFMPSDVAVEGEELQNVNNENPATSNLAYANAPLNKSTDSEALVVEEALTTSGWFFECGDDKRVDEYGFNANGNTTTSTGTLPDAASIYKYVVEIVYKGGNPGSTITIQDSSNNSHTLQRSVPFGTSSNIWVYRGLINGNTSSVTYTNGSQTSKLQSLVVYAFRNIDGASGSAGTFTNRSGYNDIQTITIGR